MTEAKMIYFPFAPKNRLCSQAEDLFDNDIYVIWTINQR